MGTARVVIKSGTSFGVPMNVPGIEERRVRCLAPIAPRTGGCEHLGKHFFVRGLFDSANWKEEWDHKDSYIIGR